jgi:hypothetical protein
MTVVVLIAAVSCTSDKEPVYKDATADIEDRVEDLIGRMTVSADEVTADGKLYEEVTVKNVSDKDGKETVHWYINDPYSHITRPQVLREETHQGG